MPKVSKEYFEKRANEIVDAAIRVCEKKPAYAVTLRDVVKECGISQGGIYNYFSDIDEIFAEIIIRANMENKIDEEKFQIFESGKTPEEIIKEAFNIVGEAVDSAIQKYGTISNEINTLYLREPERVVKILDKIKTTDTLNIFCGELLKFIELKIDEGYFNPSIPKDRIPSLLTANIQGILQIIIVDRNSSTAKITMSDYSYAVIGLLKGGF